MSWTSRLVTRAGTKEITVWIQWDHRSTESWTSCMNLPTSFVGGRHHQAATQQGDVSGSQTYVPRHSWLCIFTARPAWLLLCLAWPRAVWCYRVAFWPVPAVSWRELLHFQATGGWRRQENSRIVISEMFPPVIDWNWPRVICIVWPRSASSTNSVADSIADDITCLQQPSASDANTIYYVSGTISRSVVPRTKCDSCKEALVNADVLEPLEVDKSVDCSASTFLGSVNRGGLVRPSEYEFELGVHCWKVSLKFDAKGIKPKLMQLSADFDAMLQTSHLLCNCFLFVGSVCWSSTAS